MSGLAVAEGVAWIQVRDTTEVVVARVPEGPPLDLAGTAAVIWLAAVEGGDDDDVVARVAAWSGQPVDVVATDVRALLDDLVGRRLLNRGQSGHHTGRQGPESGRSSASRDSR